MKWLKQIRDIQQKDLEALENELTAFYKSPPYQYHSLGEASDNEWSKADKAFHWRIINRAYRGARILDVGCGSAIACSHFLENGAFYTGIDLSEKQLSLNKSRFPLGEFLFMHWRDIVHMDAIYDLVTSFFVLEHIVYPTEFIRSLSSCVKPGGYLCILCPDYLTLGYMPSIYFFGRNPGGIRRKIQNHDWIEALNEIVQRFFSFPIFLRRARIEAKRNGAWVINLRPACLDAHNWDRDWDAVYMASEEEISNFIENIGFKVVERGSKLRAAHRSEIMPSFGYVVGQKC